MSGIPKNQSRKIRQYRLEQGRCPLHNKPLMQCDGWYQRRNSKRYTITSCIEPNCRVEAITDVAFWAYRLTPRWRFLMEQDNAGMAKLFYFLPATATRSNQMADAKPAYTQPADAAGHLIGRLI